MLIGIHVRISNIVKRGIFLKSHSPLFDSSAQNISYTNNSCTKKYLFWEVDNLSACNKFPGPYGIWMFTLRYSA
jgi:hypothetical protein